MRAISLFSGAGGFEIGFDRAGIETVLQCEIDPIAQSVLRRHWPDTERISDVRDVGVGSARQGERSELGDSTRTGVFPSGGRRWFEPQSIDLVYGGFPCQDLSVAGKRAGLGGERSGLWFEFHRVLRELRPRWAVIENVVGLLSSNQGRDFGVVLEGLEELGFGGISWAVLDAQNFGVPQRRRRVFVVAGPSRRACEQVLSLCESCGGNPETGGTPGQDLAARTTHGTDGAGSERQLSPALRGSGVGTERIGDTRGQDPLVIASAISASAGHDGHSSPRGDGADNLIADTIGTITANWHKGADNTQVEMGIVPPTGVRRLTPLECERLMGWPDEFTKYDDAGRELADSHRYRLCGNGVVAPVAEWIGRRLMEVDRNDHLR